MDTRLHKVKWGTGQPRQRTSAANWREPAKWNATPFYECSACGWRGEIAGAEWSDEPYEEHRDCPKCRASALQPARRRVFCASLADVFDNEAPDEWRLDLFDLIRRTPNLDWLLLTKRIGNAEKMIVACADLAAKVSAQNAPPGVDYLAYIDLCRWLVDWSTGKPPKNIWLGATICNQEEADRDIPKLLATPAAKRFVSIEPMLGAIDLTAITTHYEYSTDVRSALHDPDDDCPDEATYLDWVICGGESGPGARPMHPDWPRALRDQCQEAGVPFLFKQWGEWLPINQMRESEHEALYRSKRIAHGGEDQLALDELYGRTCKVDICVAQLYGDARKLTDLNAFALGAMQCFRVGKKAAGNHLDGVQHLEFPK